MRRREGRAAEIRTSVHDAPPGVHDLGQLGEAAERGPAGLCPGLAEVDLIRGIVQVQGGLGFRQGQERRVHLRRDHVRQDPVAHEGRPSQDQGDGGPMPEPQARLEAQAHYPGSRPNR